MTIHWIRIDSPVGTLTLAAGPQALHAVEFAENRHPQARQGWCPGETPLLTRAARQLGEYFEGRRQHFELPLEPRGTAFQRAAWAALAEIPYGQTRSYAEQAAAIGNPRATRAVGAANGRNPLPILLPCHRVIGANGALTGFGGGIEVKHWLLSHEGIRPVRVTA